MIKETVKNNQVIKEKIMENNYKAGIDVGSTTVKLVVFDPQDQLIFSRYERHFSDVKTATIKVLKDFIAEHGDHSLRLAITGSGGMGLAEVIDVPFIQEVIASAMTIEKFIPETDVMIELGGEDAKMTFFDNGTQENSTRSLHVVGCLLKQMFNLYLMREYDVKTLRRVFFKRLLIKRLLDLPQEEKLKETLLF